MHVEWVDQEAVVLDQNDGQIHYLNAQAALVYGLVLEHGFSAAMEELRVRFGAEPEMEDQLDQLIEEMVQAGLLVEE
jgi:Coenzyme PQQ synthesis protein D (PqqD)